MHTSFPFRAALRQNVYGALVDVKAARTLCLQCLISITVDDCWNGEDGHRAPFQGEFRSPG